MFDVESLGLALKIYSLSIVFSAIAPISTFIAERDNKVATLLKVETCVQVLSTITTVIFVYYFRSVWVIIIFMALTPMLQTLIEFRMFGTAGSRFKFDVSSGLHFLSWSKYIIPSSIITLIITQFDRIYFAKVFDSELLGLYFISLSLLAVFSGLSISFARRVYENEIAAKYRDGMLIFQENYKYKNKIMIALSSCLGVAGGSAYLYFDLFYDERYFRAGDFFSVLIVSSVMALIVYTNESALVILGRTKAVLKLNFIRLLWIVFISFILIKILGSWGVIYALASVEIIPLILTFYLAKKENIIKIRKELLYLICFVVYVLAKLTTDLIISSNIYKGIIN